MYRVTGASSVVGVVGAGTMGAGIAQVAACSGAVVRVVDASPEAAATGVRRVRDSIAELVARARLSVDPATVDIEACRLADLAHCDVVVEAVVERADVKSALFAELEDIVGAECLLASNTSSLPLTTLAAGLRRPERFLGLHFFNPVPRMKLVELVPTPATAPAVVDRARRLVEGWGKQVVTATPTPAFIVNRVARPYYAEAWRLLDEGVRPEVVDAVLVGAGGFAMGPFALLDLIGQDVNEAVTRQVWDAFGQDPRFAPSLRQRSLVEAGLLGRKSGRGVYEYGDGSTAPVPIPAEPAPAPSTMRGADTAFAALLARAEVTTDGTSGPLVTPHGATLVRCDGRTADQLAGGADGPVAVVDRCLDDELARCIAISLSSNCPDDAGAEVVGLLQAAGLEVHVVPDVPGLIVTRTVAMLANVAADAVAAGVATAGDIDLAMRLGTNYPLGPLAWGERWGASVLVQILDQLTDYYRDGHHRPCPALRRRALAEEVANR